VKNKTSGRASMFQVPTSQLLQTMNIISDWPLTTTTLPPHACTQIVTLIPGFRDMSTITVLDPPPAAEPVYIFKKVFFLLFALHQRLTLRLQSNPQEKIPQVPDVSVLPMFVDNVLPTMCVHLGFVDLSEGSVLALRAWGTAAGAAATTTTTTVTTEETEGGKKKIIEGPSLSREEAYIVRAASLDAGRVAVERAHARAAAASEGGRDGDDGLGWLADMTEADLGKSLPSIDLSSRRTRANANGVLGCRFCAQTGTCGVLQRMIQN
jgi:hypothetical protein